MARRQALRSPAPATRPGASQLRIIGGQWRGRKLRFIPADGLRPTTDRVRETLFNWLAPELPGARCLDLFSGSGALGLEALSRGAAHCDFVDNNRANIERLRQHLTTLDAAANGSCHHSGAVEFLLALATTPWDVVFLDPPFGLDLVGPAVNTLCERRLLAPAARVYIETGARETLPPLPEDWLLHRDKRAGEVAYRLYHCP